MVWKGEIMKESSSETLEVRMAEWKMEWQLE
jgi:hypothetical protein